MRKSLMSLLGAAALSLSMPVLSGEPEGEPMPAPDWTQRLERARELQAEGAARKEAARKRLAEQQAQCDESFLVNNCRSRAHEAYVTASREAMRIENDGKAMEREVAREQLADKDRRAAAERLQHEADLARRESEVGAVRNAGEARRDALRADKATRAEEGARRKAAEAQRLQERQQAHAARLRSRMAAPTDGEATNSR